MHAGAAVACSGWFGTGLSNSTQTWSQVSINLRVKSEVVVVGQYVVYESNEGRQRFENIWQIILQTSLNYAAQTVHYVTRTSRRRTGDVVDRSREIIAEGARPHEHQVLLITQTLVME